MAILKMKRLRLMVVRSKKDELLRELARLGCVEFSEIGEELQEAGAADQLRRESSGLTAIKSQQTALEHAVTLLDRYAPVKSKLLSAKPELEDRTFLTDEGVSEALALAQVISDKDDQVRRITAEESRQRSVIESLQPWEGLDLPLECDGTERTGVVLGTIPARVPLADAVKALEEAADEAELFSINEDKSAHYVILVSLKEQLAAAQEALRAFGFTAAALSGMSGTPAACIAAAKAELESLAQRKQELSEEIASEAPGRDELKLAFDKVSTKAAMAEAEDRLFGTETTVVMEGWMPAEREAELAQVFDRFECAWDSRDPEPEEYPDVPVQLKNNQVTNALNMVTNMYSLPAYDGVDPNPLMAPFFILFYGLMMADMGYGLVMIAAALVAMRKIKPRAGSLSFCQLLLYGGISTFICGALTGGFFGNALEQIGKILGKPEGWGVLPSLFNPMTDSMIVLIGSMALGLIHLNTGMVISAVEKIKAGDVASAIWEEGALWVTLAGILLFVFKIGNIGGVPVVLILGCLMILYGGTRGAKGFGKLTSIFGTLYNTVTGWFGDILSYSRIMALMLAGSVIATVFNTIGAIANNLIFFFVIFIIGHGLNFALNLLGCYVHDLRLQCLEYFGKFYKDGGRAFAPLAVKTKYYNTVE